MGKLLRLYCLVVGAHSTIVSVEIGRDKFVEDLREIILQQNTAIFVGVKATRVRLYAAKTSDGQWLSSTDERVEGLATKQLSQVPGLLREKLDLAERVGSAFRSIGEHQVNVLVVAQMPEFWSPQPDYSRCFKRQQVEQNLLWCLILGERGVRFSVGVGLDDDVAGLQEVIKKKRENTFQGVDAAVLLLALAKTDDGEWLHSETPQVEKLAYADSATISEFREKKLDPGEKLANLFTGVHDNDIHVLVLPPRTTSTEIVDADQWFPREMKTVVCTDDAVDKVQYFEMLRFPPVMTPMTQYPAIVERSCHAVIFEEMMKFAVKRLERQFSADLVVTGNPGIGKGRFYLYCAFQLIRGHAEGVDLSKYTLVLNYDDDYHRYCPRRQAFLGLSKTEVYKLKATAGVIRLVDGESSRLRGWNGVSILFASPGAKGMRKFARDCEGRFIMPTWTLRELQMSNALLASDFKLSDDELRARYDMYGGIPRRIFAPCQGRFEVDAMAAVINSVEVLELLDLVTNRSFVSEANLSDRILGMVPVATDCKCFHRLEFLSSKIAGWIVERAQAMNTLEALSNFALQDSDDAFTAPFRQQLREALGESRTEG